MEANSVKEMGTTFPHVPRSSRPRTYKRDATRKDLIGSLEKH